MLGAPHVAPEVLATHQLHGEAPAGTDREQLVQGDEIGMCQVHQAPELTLEPVDGPRLGAPQNLERDRRPTLAVVGFVDSSESARPQAPHERPPVGKTRHLRPGDHPGWGFRSIRNPSIQR